MIYLDFWIIGLLLTWRDYWDQITMVETSKIQKSKNPPIHKHFHRDTTLFFFTSRIVRTKPLDFWIFGFLYIFFYYSSINLLSNDVFTRSEVGTGWKKIWFHFGLRDEGSTWPTAIPIETNMRQGENEKRKPVFQSKYIGMQKTYTRIIFQLVFS